MNAKDHNNNELPEAGISFCMLDAHDLENHRTGKVLPREFYCDRFHLVTHCCMVTVGKEIAHIHWVYFKGDFSRFLKIESDSAEINYVYTLPDYRERGIGAAALAYTMNRLKESGVGNVFTVIHDENIASIKCFTHVGFCEVGKTVAFGPFNRKVAV